MARNSAARRSPETDVIDPCRLAPTLAVEERPVGSLAPCANNARRHSDKQIEKIAGSIRSFGFVNPILIDAQGGVVAGHGRLEAA